MNYERIRYYEGHVQIWSGMGREYRCYHSGKHDEGWLYSFDGTYVTKIGRWKVKK